MTRNMSPRVPILLSVHDMHMRQAAARSRCERSQRINWVWSQEAFGDPETAERRDDEGLQIRGSDASLALSFEQCQRFQGWKRDLESFEFTGTRSAETVELHFAMHETQRLHQDREAFAYTSWSKSGMSIALKVRLT
jgi:hypothetical protein